MEGLLIRITFKILNKAMKYAQSHFENNLWNKNETLVGFQCYSGFSVWAGISWPKLWQLYKEFDIDILDFAGTPIHLLY